MRRGFRWCRVVLVGSAPALLGMGPGAAAGQPPARLEMVGSGALKDQVSGLLWAASDNGADVSWSEADGYCRDLRLGGEAGWQLPRLDELLPLVDPRGLPLRIVPGIRLTTGWVWSADRSPEEATEQEERPLAWFFSFQSGKPGATQADRRERFRALCVHRPQGG